MKQYWIAKLPPGFLLKRKKPWNSTDVGDRGTGMEDRACWYPHSNEMAQHWSLAGDWWVLALWKMWWEAFINHSLFWEQSTPWEPYPAAQTPVPAASRWNPKVAKAALVPLGWKPFLLCTVCLNFGCTQPSLPAHTAPAAIAVLLTRARGRAVSPAVSSAGTSLGAGLLPSPWIACRELTAAEVARSESSLERCCRVQHLCGALLECKASGADVETW